jgi:hypothetical protein
MATIKLEIDTDAGIREHVQSSSMPTTKFLSKPMVLVSTIKLNKQFRSAFENGANQTPLYYDGIDYDQIAKKIQQVNGPNRLIITGGGLIAFQAAKQYATQCSFVSLVGVEPTGNIGTCYGGLSLRSFESNSARVDWLVGTVGRTRAGIGLFRNAHSPITQQETQNWQSIAGVNHTIAYGGNTLDAQGNRHNDSSHYLDDLNAADAGITTMIISADPFFQDTKEKLIEAANTWVTGAPDGTTRHVCYPFKEYSNVHGSHTPTPNTASWYGPSLEAAYGQLGTSAQIVLTATSSIGFSGTTDDWDQF